MAKKLKTEYNNIFEEIAFLTGIPLDVIKYKTDKLSKDMLLNFVRISRFGYLPTPDKKYQYLEQISNLKEVSIAEVRKICDKFTIWDFEKEIMTILIKKGHLRQEKLDIIPIVNINEAVTNRDFLRIFVSVLHPEKNIKDESDFNDFGASIRLHNRTFHYTYTYQEHGILCEINHLEESSWIRYDVSELRESYKNN